MSDASRNALVLVDCKSYLQSPVDDIESFSWVLLHSIVWNTHGPHSRADHQLQCKLDSGDRHAALAGFMGAWTNGECSQLTHVLSASRLFGKYAAAIRALHEQWEDDKETLTAAKVHDAQAWELCYHAAAVHGLLVVLQLLVDVKNKLKIP